MASQKLDHEDDTMDGGYLIKNWNGKSFFRTYRPSVKKISNLDLIYNGGLWSSLVEERSSLPMFIHSFLESTTGTQRSQHIKPQSGVVPAWQISFELQSRFPSDKQFVTASWYDTVLATVLNIMPGSKKKTKPLNLYHHFPLYSRHMLKSKYSYTSPGRIVSQSRLGCDQSLYEVKVNFRVTNS